MVELGDFLPSQQRTTVGFGGHGTGLHLLLDATYGAPRKWGKQAAPGAPRAPGSETSPKPELHQRQRRKNQPMQEDARASNLSRGPGMAYLR